MADPNCKMCGLCETRTSVVQGKGNLKSKLMLLGEAPGADEDLLGEPFVGRCGDLLTKMLSDLDIHRDSLYITNTVKCRPVEGKKNRPPKKEEIQSCKGWLWDEIQSITPKVIITFGKVATSLLLKISKHKLKLGDVVGKIQNVDYMDTIIVPCYHPSYLMQTGKGKMQDSIDAIKLAKEVSDGRTIF
jgi:uracil-DNA glycosylase|tara:strand:- start:1112 stop:1675 length:564 start_codon:yes stop_codon:yes gene_type:complete